MKNPIVFDLYPGGAVSCANLVLELDAIVGVIKETADSSSILVQGSQAVNIPHWSLEQVMEHVMKHRAIAQRAAEKRGESGKQ